MWWRKEPVAVPDPPQPKVDPHPDKTMYLGKSFFAEFNPASDPDVQPWQIYNTRKAMAPAKTGESSVFWVTNRSEAVRLVDYFDKVADSVEV